MTPTRIVHAKPPKRVKPAKKLRPPPACGVFVHAKHPKEIVRLRIRSEVLYEAVKPEPVRRRSIGIARKATAEEVAECLRFIEHSEPVMARIAAERLLEHVQACGYVLMTGDEGSSNGA
jgi:hypothetical protein